MGFDWRKYLELAKELQSRSSEEAQRSSISRAYYAVFCSGRNHLKAKGYVYPGTGEEHRFVWDKFQAARRECRHLGVLGDRLKRRRKAADYDEDIPNLAKESEQSILDAEQFFNELRNSCP